MALQGRRRLAFGLIAAALLLAAVAAALYFVSRARCFTLVGDMVCRVETQRPMVALTFDDGPTEAGVDFALAELRKSGAKATFFLVGSAAGEQPHLVRGIVEEGHEIGNHSFTQKRMVGRSAGFYDAEIAETHRALVAAGAPPPRLFRPPYGKKLWGLPLAVERHGYRMVMIDVEEPTTVDPRAYADQMVADSRPGSILLMHLMFRSNETARQALPLVIAGLKARGFEIVTVGELLRRR